jgi:hypothetical protein
VIRLKGVDIILTYECTGRCAHCCYRAGPGRDQTMGVSEVERYLAGVAGHPVEYILLFGGEPFICYDLLRTSVALAATLAKVLVFTNGSWATDSDTALRLLAGLQEAGLDYMLFSVDAFHQARVPLERIAVGIEAARDLRYSTIEIDNRYLGDPATGNNLNRHTRELMKRLAGLCDLGGVNVYSGPSHMVGRACDELSRYVPTHVAVPARCCLPDYLGGDLRAPTGVEIHPGGWVNLCGGLALGNANRTDLGEIVAAYDPTAHPIIEILLSDGPPGLRELARRHGYVSSSGYVDACHLCYEARRFLQPWYPDHLAPSSVYEDTA